MPKRTPEAAFASPAPAARARIVFSKANSPAELSLRGIRLAGNLRDCTIDEAYPAMQRNSGPDSSELSKEILRE
jgi:hypothetical protein